MSTHIGDLQKKIHEAEFDAFLITNTTNVYYFTEFFSRSAAYLLVSSENTPLLIVPELEYEEATNTVTNSEIIKLEKSSKLIELIKQKLDEQTVHKLAIEENSMTVRSYLDISDKIKSVKLEKGSDLIDNLRKIKNKEEIEHLKTACKIADVGIKTAIDSIEDGKLEIEIAAEIEYIMRQNSSEAVPFDTIVASGSRSAYPHGVSSHKKMKQGDLIIIDVGAKYKGYCSDMTRTVILGTPTKKQAEIFNTVLASEQEAIKSCQIGKKAAEIDEIARNILSRKGLDDYFVHSLGHGVGLEVHELPTLASISEDVLMENSTFTIEPGVYIPDFGGVRLEDVVVLTKNGAQILTKTAYSISI